MASCRDTSCQGILYFLLPPQASVRPTAALGQSLTTALGVNRGPATFPHPCWDVNLAADAPRGASELLSTGVVREPGRKPSRSEQAWRSRRSVLGVALILTN